MDQKAANIVELDVRPQLREKQEPFQLIMDTVKTLEENSIFVLHATFKPTQLLGVLEIKGLVGKSEQKDEDHWITTFVNIKNKSWLDDQTFNAEDCVESKDSSPLSEDLASSNEDGPKTITLDNRGLEPPQPMMLTLAALERSRPGDTVYIHNDRVPVFLIEELNSLGCPFTIEDQSDGSAKVKIQKT